MKLTLVRHGESTWNAMGRWQGQCDVPLSARGRLEARALAARLDGASFERRIASDLSRAFETASLLGERVETDRRLREIDVGAWAGLHRDEVAERFADELAGMRAGRPVRLGGGESLPELEARVDAIADELAALHPGRPVLAVTHGGVVRALVSRALGTRGRASPLVGVGNTSISVIDFGAGAPRLEVYNDTMHLGALGRAPHASGEPSPRVVLVAADPAASAGPGRAGGLAPAFEVARIGAAGLARELALADELAAEPLEGDAADALAAMRAKQAGGTFALVLVPDDLVALVGRLLGLASTAGLAPPPHRAIAQLELSRGGALLHSYGIGVTREGAAG